jgi:hypothetical protein
MPVCNTVPNGGAAVEDLEADRSLVPKVGAEQVRRLAGFCE